MEHALNADARDAIAHHVADGFDRRETRQATRVDARDRVRTRGFELLKRHRDLLREGSNDVFLAGVERVPRGIVDGNIEQG